MKSITTILLFAITVSAQSSATYIKWRTSADGFALSSLGGTGLTNLKANTASSNAQFLYTKESQSSPLVDVYLKNTENNKEVLLQASFSMTNQQCSCYWLDAADLAKRFPALVSGQKYRIVFRSQKSEFELPSGLLGLQLPASNPNVTTTTTTATVQSTSVSGIINKTTFVTISGAATTTSCSDKTETETTPCATNTDDGPSETNSNGSVDPSRAKGNSESAAAALLLLPSYLISLIISAIL